MQPGNVILEAVERWLERLPVWQDATLRGCMAVASVGIAGAILQLSTHHTNGWWFVGYGVPYTIVFTSGQMVRCHRRACRRREQARW
jgi:hypothetical protein